MSNTTPGVMAAVGGPSINPVDDEFPILCETCLGENPLVRMTKEPFGKACKICERPFTIYRWKPGPKARYKKTELCHTCAKLKNVCQTCILDLQFGLPVQVRDQMLAQHQRMELPKSDVGRAYMMEQQERAMATLGGATMSSVVPPEQIKGSILERYARRQPYYKRNEAHLCSFFARGECNRGLLCTFRHEMPQDNELNKQNFKDRYYGNNDPVARKMMKKMGGASASLLPPDDPKITTLWLGNVPERASEDEIRVKFHAFGELQSVRVIPQKNCCFVTYQHRAAAEEAAKKLHDKLVLHGQSIRVSWGRDKNDAPPGIKPPGIKNKQQNDNATSSSSSSSSDAAATTAAAPVVAPVFFPPPPPPPGMASNVRYASQDPRQNASKLL